MIGAAYGGDSGSAVNVLSQFAENGGVRLDDRNPDARGLLTHGAVDAETGLVPLPVVFGTTVAQAQAIANEGGFCLVMVLANRDPATVPPAPETDACRQADVPGIVQGLAALAGDSEVALDWSPPADDGGAAVTGYTVYYGSGSFTDSFPVSATAATIGGLENGVTYMFTVTASNAAGEGPQAAPVSATPAAPVRFTVEVSVDGGDWFVADGYDASSEAWQHQVGDLPDGQHTVAARLMDLGMQRGSASVTITVVHDADGDGVGDADDACPGFDDSVDVDGDGIADGCDDLIDSDGDGVADDDDVCPGFDDSADLDGDGVPDGCDDDRDGDGFSNDEEGRAGTDPDDAGSKPRGPTCDQYPPQGGPPHCRAD